MFIVTRPNVGSGSYTEIGVSLIVDHAQYFAYQ